jgi:hypothetical protein
MPIMKKKSIFAVFIKLKKKFAFYLKSPDWKGDSQSF